MTLSRRDVQKNCSWNARLTLNGTSAGTTLSIDNSVMDRFGNLLRCTWSWYSGRYHKVIRGQDLLGLV